MATEDLEIAAMGSISTALAGLDGEARSRVLDWAAKRFGAKLSESSRSEEGSSSGSGGEGDGGREQRREFVVFADLFDATSPRLDTDRALVGGYWFQEVVGQSDFGGQEVNNALKDVGHGVGNITSALGRLQAQRPALVRQVSKSGRSRQARKKDKLTTAGVTTVRAMVDGAAAGQEDE